MLAEMQEVSGKVRERQRPFARTEPGALSSNQALEKTIPWWATGNFIYFVNTSLPLLTCTLKYLLSPQPHILSSFIFFTVILSPTTYLLFMTLWASTPYLQSSLLFTALFIPLHAFLISLISSSFTPSLSLTPFSLTHPLLLFPLPTDLLVHLCWL